MNEITLRAFFGDGERAFCLTDPMLAELERIAGQGIGAVYYSLANMTYPARILPEIIRLGLIGAGTNPEEAARLIGTYATNRPLAEVFPLAFEVLEARWTGTKEESNG